MYVLWLFCVDFCPKIDDENYGRFERIQIDDDVRIENALRACPVYSNLEFQKAGFENFIDIFEETI